MFNLISMEIKNCVNAIRFKIMFGILFSLTIIQYLFVCSKSYGLFNTSVTIDYRTGIMQGNIGRQILFLFLMISPLVACFMYSDSYYREHKTKLELSLISRVGKKNYCLSKLFAIAIISFLSVFIVLSINEILTYITFHDLGSFDPSGPLYDLIRRHSPNEFLKIVAIKNPYLYNFILIAINSLYVAILSVVAYTFTLIFTEVKALAVIIGVFILNYSLDLLLETMKLHNFSMLGYRQGYGDLISFLVVISLWIILIITTFIIGIKKDTI